MWKIWCLQRSTTTKFFLKSFSTSSHSNCCWTHNLDLDLLHSFKFNWLGGSLTFFQTCLLHLPFKPNSNERFISSYLRHASSNDVELVCTAFIFLNALFSRKLERKDKAAISKLRKYTNLKLGM